MRGLTFLPYAESLSVPNVVVDGAPNPATVLTLTHWPGIEQPPGLAGDLSAHMAFNYLDAGAPATDAQVVTNNHFDQDGLVCVHALVDPERSLRYRDRLVDIAAAGDFATYRYRESARASMAIWSYANSEYSPLGSQLEGPYEQACALLYETLLPLLIPIIEDPDQFKDLWIREDQHLTGSEQAIAAGQVAIEEVPELDLAVVSVSSPLAGGHRFASDFFELIHPMAINNATNCSRLLLASGDRYLYADRYETWVQYRSRLLPKRVDLRPLAEQLQALETGAHSWQATAPSALTPTLSPTSASDLDLATVRESVMGYLQSAPPAWDPFS